MGQTNTTTGRAETDSVISAIAPKAPSEVSDLAQSVIQSASPTAAKRARLAGELLSAFTKQESFSDANAASKYSPEKVSKSPSSQLLSYGASPTRLSGS